MRLYDLTSPELRADRDEEVRAAAPPSPGGSPTRWPTRSCSSSPGEPGVADTKIAYVAPRGGTKEIGRDGLRRRGPAAAHREPVASISRRAGAPTPARWPSRRTCGAIPYLYRLFAVRAAARTAPGRLPRHQLARRRGARTAASVALTLSKDGNPEIYVLTLATGSVPPPHHASRHRHRADWSPDRTADRLRLRSGGAAADLRDGRRRRQRPALTQSGLQHPAALVAQGRRHRLHVARRARTISGW